MQCMTLQTLAVIAWFAILIVVLVLIYMYFRDRKACKKPVLEKIEPATEKTSDRSYTIVVEEDGSVQVFLEDGQSGGKLPSGRPRTSAYSKGKTFANKNQLARFLGGAITSDLPEVIPYEKGTYALILHVWKNNVNPFNVKVGGVGVKCRFCGAPNEGDACYCKKCGKQLE